MLGYSKWEYCSLTITKCVLLLLRELKLNMIILLWQTYREDLGDFRTSVLPRQFSQTFSEAPDSHTIRDKLGSVNSRYERLKTRCLDHRNRLADIQEKQQRYRNEVNPVLPWLDVSYVTLGKMVQEPIAAEPNAVKQQIAQLKVCAMIHTTYGLMLIY